MAETARDVSSFERFVGVEGERVRRALVAMYGVEVGTEASSEAMALAWERWSEIAEMANPAGYLFRVGQSKVRPLVRWKRRRRTFPSVEPAVTSDDAALIDLFDALAGLSPRERAVVMLVKSHGYSYREVAELLGVSEAVVNNSMHRAVARLRSALEVAP